MKKTDIFLIGIVIGIVLLVVIAFGLALSKPEPTYQAEDTPDGVAFNYLFALQQKDYERAYKYLSSSIDGYPRNVENFSDDIRDYPYWFNRLNDSSTTLDVDSIDENGNRADVKIRETRFYEGDLFSSSQYTSTFNMTLRKDQNGAWKIVDSDRYWLSCWNRSDGCN